MQSVNFQGESVKINGVVSSVDSEFKSKTVHFTIYCPKIGQYYKAQYTGFCPIRKDDIVSGQCMLMPDNSIIFHQHPFVQISCNKESIIRMMMTKMKIGYNKAVQLYKIFESYTSPDCDNVDSAVIAWISSKATDFLDRKDYSALDEFVTLGIDTETAKNFLTMWHKSITLRKLYLLGLTNKDIMESGLAPDTLYEQLITNPFVVPSIDLEKAKDICVRINRSTTSEDIYCGVIIRTVWDFLNKRGWTCVNRRVLYRQHPDIDTYIERLEREYLLIFDKEMESYYLKYPYTVECEVAKSLAELLEANQFDYDSPVDDVKRLSAHYSADVSDDQKKAIQGALDHTLSIITGGAGTGKTRCLGQIVYNLLIREIKYVVCSFTGKAVARIREVLKSNEPRTMHSLIAKLHPDCEKITHLIIDEASTVTIELLYRFLKCYPNISNITLIGDCNQLPPIGWGSMFYQLMYSKRVPIYMLTTNYRVYRSTDGAIDGIIYNANNLIAQHFEIPFQFKQFSNFYLYENSEKLVESIVKALKQAEYTPDKFVILSPYNQYLKNFNRCVQDLYNQGQKSVSSILVPDVFWRIGDRVMATKNVNSYNIFNGEIGVIEDVDEKKVAVRFDDARLIDFNLNRKGFDNFDIEGDDNEIVSDLTVAYLTHAYAMTVDKSQGSEWDFVIFAVPHFSNMGGFVNRNRVYTAITRAKRAVYNVVVSAERYDATSSVLISRRCENLAKRLVKGWNLPKFEIWKSQEITPLMKELSMDTNIDQSDLFDDDDDEY